ncbi:MAG TPA: Crp/Fnr family transcriptional regulator [Acidimicrobiales bacterium]|nr:Crp/Fnr family transcriptional regulator [Acidimicrobiales bacterium]
MRARGHESLLARAGRARIAATPEEREAIYRFRWSVYVDELGRKLGRGDPERRWVHDDEDDRPYTTLLYTGSPEEMTGTLRVRHWAAGEVPPADRRAFSMHLFAGVDELSVCELGRFMIQPDARNRLVFVSLCREAYEVAAARGLDLAFANCAPRLVPLYVKLGFRPYPGSPIATPDGVEVPLVMVPADEEHFERVGSFFAPLVARHYGPGRHPPLSTESYRELLDQGDLPYVTDPAAVWERVQHHLETSGRRGLLEALEPETVRKLATSGSLLAVPAGELLTEKGLSQQEMFLVVEGLFEAVDGDRRLGLVGEGEVAGEMAFFGTLGRRSASVRAVSDGRVLVLTRPFLDQLRATDPVCAADLLFHVARVLADRAVAAIV